MSGRGAFDFFPSYESFSVRRQKGLIHLIHELSDDLFKNPFNEGFKTLVSGFGLPLKKIVRTIDRYGLKAYHLKKHRKDVNRYDRNFLEAESQNNLSAKYTKHLKKTGQSSGPF